SARRKFSGPVRPAPPVWHVRPAEPGLRAGGADAQRVRRLHGRVRPHQYRRLGPRDRGWFRQGLRSLPVRRPRMTTSPANPLGLDGFEFVEFTSPDPARMTALIEQLGFVAYARHQAKDLVRYKQGRINLLVNQDPGGQAAAFRTAHGPSASGMAFRVADAERALELALQRGAK